MSTRLRDYGLALTSVIVAGAIRFALIPVLGNRFGFDLFLISTFVSGRYLGFRPAVFALLAGAVPVTAFHFLGPNPDLYDPYFPVGMFAYFMFGAIVVALCKSEHEARGALQRELTERRGMETELRDSRQQLMLAIEAGRLGTWQLDMRTNRVKWSGLMESMHGYALGTFGGTLSDAVANSHPEDRDQIVRDIAQGPNNSADIRFTYRVTSPEGQTRWIQGIGQRFRDELGNPVQSLGVCLDVTEQKEAELALRQ